MVSGELPTRADDAQWDKAVRTDVNLQNYIYEGGKRAALTVNAVSVQAVANESAVAFRIFWDDPVENSKGLADALLVAFRPSDYNGDPRGNLYTLYGYDDPALDIMQWNASNPGKVGQKKSNLSSAIRSGWTANQNLSASAAYEDGRWTLVFVRPLDLDGAEKLEHGSVRLIGFTATDGQNNEAGIKRATSQWIRLALGASEAH